MSRWWIYCWVFPNSNNLRRWCFSQGLTSWLRPQKFAPAKQPLWALKIRYHQLGQPRKIVPWKGWLGRKQHKGLRKEIKRCSQEICGTLKVALMGCRWRAGPPKFTKMKVWTATQDQTLTILLLGKSDKAIGGNPHICSIVGSITDRYKYVHSKS